MPSLPYLSARVRCQVVGSSSSSSGGGGRGGYNVARRNMQCRFWEEGSSWFCRRRQHMDVHLSGGGPQRTCMTCCTLHSSMRMPSVTRPASM